MRTFRPSPKATVVVAGLAVALVIGGSAGAVAGRLVTSQDIKDGTIQTKDLKADSVTAGKLAPGAVSWDKSLDDATKKAIESLLSDPVPGPQGETGARGPQGERGLPGIPGDAGVAGVAGDGSYVAGGIYGLDGYSATDDDFAVSELYPASGDDITLSVPGNYLVSMQGLFLDTGAVAAPFIFTGEPEEEFTAILNACTPSSTYFVPMCTTTFPVTVHTGETVHLPVLVPTTDVEECTDDCDPLALARVAVYRQGGEATDDLDFPDVDDCGCARLAPSGTTSRQTQAWGRAAQRYLNRTF